MDSQYFAASALWTMSVASRFEDTPGPDQFWLPMATTAESTMTPLL